jgi:tRNA pseudouridine38-40 synthase
MRKALKLFAGRRDFRFFCHLPAPARDMTGKPDAGDSPGFSPTPAFCTLARLGLSELGDETFITIRGDRFLYKMVRRIVGAVVTYGAGGITLADVRAALAGRKHQPFPTAPACGLLLDSVEY